MQLMQYSRLTNQQPHGKSPSASFIHRTFAPLPLCPLVIYRLSFIISSLNVKLMPRVLLLLPTTTYRAADFLAAAERMNVDVVAASEKPNVMASKHPEVLLTLDFRDPEAAARTVREFNEACPIRAA